MAPDRAETGASERWSKERVWDAGRTEIRDALEQGHLSLVGNKDGERVDWTALAAGGYLYILFFSSNCYSGSLYDSSYATSVNGVAGPYTKSSAPLLVTGTDGLYSPGKSPSCSRSTLNGLALMNILSAGGLDVGPGGARVMFHSDQGTSANVRVAHTGSITINVSARTVSI